MTAWLRTAFRRLVDRRRPCSAREALAEAHAEAWDLAAELLELEERGVAPTTAERERAIASATRIARNAARELGWIGE